MEVKLIDYNKINSILNNFLEPFDCEAEPDSDFAYYGAHNLITYSLTVVDSCSDSFLLFAKKLFPNIHADIFLWSFLHELGHHETEDDFDEEDWKNYRYDAVRTTSNEEYYNLPIEYAATVWAGEYIESHEKEIASLWKELQSAIKETYISLEIKF